MTGHRQIDKVSKKIPGSIIEQGIGYDSRLRYKNQINLLYIFSLNDGQAGQPGCEGEGARFAVRLRAWDTHNKRIVCEGYEWKPAPEYMTMGVNVMDSIADLGKIQATKADGKGYPAQIAKKMSTMCIQLKIVLDSIGDILKS